jgi:hypothetical protein
VESCGGKATMPLIAATTFLFEIELGAAIAIHQCRLTGAIPSCGVASTPHFRRAEPLRLSPPFPQHGRNFINAKCSK